MKYELGASVELFLWAVAGVLLTLLMVPAAIAVPKPEMNLSPLALAAIMFGAIIVGAVFFIIMSRFWDRVPKWLRVVLGMTGLLLMAIVFGRLVLTGFNYLMGSSFQMTSFLAIAEAAAVGLSMWIIGVMMLKTTKLLGWTARFTSFAMVMAMSAIAATFGPMLSVPVIAALLVAIAIYDVIAVFKMKTMQKMAKEYMQSGWFFGVVVPRPKRTKDVFKSVAFLGGGDVFFLGLVTATLMVTRISWVLPVALSMLAALFWLMVVAEKKKSYPAMLPISTGALLAMLCCWIAGV